MINFRLRTEYSFGEVYGPLDRVIDRCRGQSSAAITDRGGTWGHVQWRKRCKIAGIKPIYGVELAVVSDEDWDEKKRVQPAWITFLATDSRSLAELYGLATLATAQAKFRPRLRYGDIASLSQDVEVLVGQFFPQGELARLHRKPKVLLAPGLPSGQLKVFTDAGLDLLPASENFYPAPNDAGAFEIIAGDFRESRADAMHILEQWEWDDAFPQFKGQHAYAQEYADRFTADLPTAEMVHFVAASTLREMCVEAATKRGIDLANKVYADRLKRELDLIAEKKFEDYFYVIADMLAFAKTKMLVGPARGSSCGSLVCFLLGITEIDPIPHNLLFERFIDINRQDLPDIDIDFPDTKRDLVFDYMRSKYGAECVVRLGTIGKFKAKSAIGDVAKALNIPQWEVADLKNSIIERSTGDSRAAFCISDTFEQLDVGKNLVAKYPGLLLASKIEAHASHAGQHAAGIVVTAQPVKTFCSVDMRTGAAQVDKYDAESLNLLKIDALGLRTLSVIEDCLEQIGKPYEWIIKYPLDDVAAFDVINSKRFAGIFQFEGLALQSLCNQMAVERFEDISALTALARPGPLSSGGTAEWLKRRTGKSEIKHLHPLVEPITKETLGIVVYQEDVLRVSREFGDLSWEDCSSLRKAMSKSLGKEFFETYWLKFKAGTDAKGIPEDQARHVWDNVNTMGCLSGDTIIRNAYPNQFYNEPITIRELAEKRGFMKGMPKEYRRPNRKDRKGEFPHAAGKRQVVYALQNGVVKPLRCLDAFHSGVKDTFKLSLDCGHSIRATTNHKFLNEDMDWVELRSLKLGDRIAIIGETILSSRKQKTFTGSGAHNPRNNFNLQHQIAYLRTKYKKCQICKKAPYQETHHINMNHRDNRIENLKPACRSCHKKLHAKAVGSYPAPHSVGKGVQFSTIMSIGSKRREKVYDISMPAPYNNFVANGIIVHNSWAFNKSHSVAYGVVSYWCCVLKAHHPLEYAAACLRHAKDDDQSIKLLRELHREGFKYKAFDMERSTYNWSVQNNELIGGLIGVKGIGDKTARDISARREAGQELTGGQKKKLANAITPWDTIFECQNRWGHIISNPMAHNILSPIIEINTITSDSDGGFLVIGKLIEKNLRDHNEVVNLQKRGGKKMEGQSLFLNVTIEDDTGSITCGINRYKYLALGKPIVEEGKIGDWYLIKGNNRRGFRRLAVERIRKLS